LGQVLPGNTGSQHEQEAGQGLSILDGLSSRVAIAPGFGRWKEGVKDLPKIIIQYRLGHVLSPFVSETLHMVNAHTASKSHFVRDSKKELNIRGLKPPFATISGL
jgi:hypothetical protein